ncbi:glutaredoxin 3 [Planoprotostelium fungivorum]|uniref:Glutaredoxin 3 n=1 Tax=Planoprotostelium fungivorum TaxID=1890364 RepID=A0A2P6NSS8_9EUKA|nr:glutaredoxin 3 [Planoprotostelium fungivorum]
MPATVLESVQQLQKLVKEKSVVVLSFWAEWAAPSVELNVVFDQLADLNQQIFFAKVEAEKLADVTEQFDISSVPSFVFLQKGKIVHKIEGAFGSQLTEQVVKYSKIAQASSQESTTKPKEGINVRLQKLLSKSPIMLFMKGTPEAPQCGFSRKIIDLIKAENVQFDTFNILLDEEVRQGLKEYSNWPTYPQLYVNGKLVGGLDIVRELAEEGELKMTLQPASSQGAAVGDSVKEAPAKEEKPTKENLNARIEALLKSSKGTPAAPQCGFSRKIVDLLNENSVTFNSFNILADDEGLKEYSNWPTYPQLYNNAKLVGGLDIVKELAEEGELAQALE